MAEKKNRAAATEVESAIQVFNQTVADATEQLTELRRIRNSLSETIEKGADALNRLVSGAPIGPQNIGR